MIEFLMEHAEKHPVSFHMPGHKGRKIFEKYGYGGFIEQLCDCDITEIPGADNLFQAEGIIKDVQERYASLYDSDRSYLLINGTSGGLMAAVMAAAGAGEKIIMARNCHKSVYNGLILGGIQPVYIYPEIEETWGICAQVPPEAVEKAVSENPDAKAVVVTSPNYYGICSDIGRIAEIVHDAGMILIVDQAHGAHLHFFHKYHVDDSLPLSAEMCGADISVCSTHKTLASLTQSAVLNLNGDRIEPPVLEDRLQRVESTSPSYILMAFLDINARILEEHGKTALTEWIDGIRWFEKKADSIRGLDLMKPELFSGDLLDSTKIDISMTPLGLDGAQLEKELMERDVFCELSSGDLLMLMTGIGNTKDDMKKLAEALLDIAEVRTLTDGKRKMHAGFTGMAEPGPARRIPSESEQVPLERAPGRVCASLIIPYPPGIPICCPGEVITEETAAACAAMRKSGEKVIGIGEDGTVAAGKEK